MLYSASVAGAVSVQVCSHPPLLTAHSFVSAVKSRKNRQRPVMHVVLNPHQIASNTFASAFASPWFGRLRSHAAHHAQPLLVLTVAGAVVCSPQVPARSAEAEETAWCVFTLLCTRIDVEVALVDICDGKKTSAAVTGSLCYCCRQDASLLFPGSHCEKTVVCGLVHPVHKLARWCGLGKFACRPTGASGCAPVLLSMQADAGSQPKLQVCKWGRSKVSLERTLLLWKTLHA